MPVPDFQSLLLPLLRLAGDGRDHALPEARKALASEFALSPEDVAQLLPSGRQTVLANRTAWAKVYLTRAGLLDSPLRGHFQITSEGAHVLESALTKIDIKFLQKYPGFAEFRERKTDGVEWLVVGDSTSVRETPEESLEDAYLRLRRHLANELLQRTKSATPEFFEQLVVELLLKMGYGGSRKEAGEAIGRSGDEGIDGVISEDRLGLDVIYIQAKKWESTVGRPEVQKFVGALHGKRAKKGVFLTTGTFSQEARQYVSHIDPKVVLIDGALLAELMIDYDLGVTAKGTYQVKQIDSDYFGEQ
ncbi:MAG TPA: restriction endonuclease [Thermoanaerobaculia bacterium]|jgi:restriction system protein